LKLERIDDAFSGNMLQFSKQLNLIGQTEYKKYLCAYVQARHLFC